MRQCVHPDGYVRARARAHVRMASACFDGQKLITYAHRPEVVSGRVVIAARERTNGRTNERAEAFSRRDYHRDCTPDRKPRLMFTSA